MPVDDIADGMMGEGWTVSQGETPEPFDAEVLGVLPDGVGPGRDMIIIEASSDAVMESGIWFGMSGSPVYFDGKLMGVLAYGLSWGPSQIAGLTAAEDIVNVMDYPEGPSQAASGTGAGLEKVNLSRSLARRVASATGTTAAQSDSMVQLKAPLSVSGLSPRAMKRLRRTIAREKLPYVAYKGASAAATTTADLGVPPTAGESFAAALSYGDVTLAGIGTMSIVCDQQGVAFGHPFSAWPPGPTLLGANRADALTIVTDSIGGSYKLATVEEGVGLVDQDRFAGIRALFDVAPTTIPITSSITATDWDRTRDGQTDVLSSEWAAYVGFGHVLSNIDMTFDQIGPGSSVASFVVHGERQNGTPFVLARNNMHASEYDISYETVSELDRVLYSLFYNGFEDITFTGIDIEADVEQALKMYTLEGVRVSRNGGAYNSVRRLRVRPGDRLSLRVILDDMDSAAIRRETFSFRVPLDARRSGYLRVNGGGRSYYFDSEECLFDDSCDTTDGDGFGNLLNKLQNAATNDQLSAKLRIGRRVVSNQKMLLGQAVRGSASIYLNLGGGGGTSPSEGGPAKG